MIENKLDLLTTETLACPSSCTNNMLENNERVLGDTPPLQRLRLIDEDTYEELVCVWAYYCLKDKNYQEVYRVGQSGDKGRDVLAYYNRLNGIYDLYQCKHYKSQLTYTDIRGEMGKLLVYTYSGIYPIPRNYFLMCPHDVSQNFMDLLSNNAQNLKKKLKEDWSKEIKTKVGNNWIELDNNLSEYIDAFDFNIVQKIEPIKFIDDLRSTPFYFCYFGGGFQMIHREPITVPDEPAMLEQQYINHLNEAYSEHANTLVDATTESPYLDQKYKRHLDRARSDFYESEEVKIASRQSTAPDSDEFEHLKSSIERFVGNEYDEDYIDGFTKVKAVENKASTFRPARSLIQHIIDGNVCIGVCHQLSNENKLQWKVRK